MNQRATGKTTATIGASGTLDQITGKAGVDAGNDELAGGGR